MKKFIMFFVFILFIFSSTSFAQVYPGDNAGAKADFLYKKLNLSNEQYSNVYSLFLDFHMKLKAIELNRMAQFAKDKQIEDMKNKINSDIENLLTKEQKDKWNSVKDKVWKVKYIKKVKKISEEKTEENKKEEKKEEKK